MNELGIEKPMPPGMRQKELRENCTCRVCQKKIGQKVIPMLWKIHTERHLIDLRAIKRQSGLEMVVGHPALAMAMGPDEYFTVVASVGDIIVCDECMLDRLPEAFESK